MTVLIPDDSARITAVVDHTTSRGDVPWMARWWRTGGVPRAFDANIDDPAWGLLMAELFEMLGEDDDHTPAQILERALTKLPWKLFPCLQYAVLNACRALRFAREGVICSKIAGGEWALGTLPQHGIAIGAAVAEQRGAFCTPSSDARSIVEDVLQCLRDDIP